MAATQRRGWSDLQPELLELVLRRLVLRDYLKCRGVCRSWRSIVVNAIKNKCPPLPQFPSLLLIPGKSSSDNKVPATLLDITGNKQLQLTPSRAWERYFDCVQSKEGWLMFRQCRAIRDNNIYHTLFWIFNPVSGEEYKLPLLPCSWRYNAFTRDIVAISSAVPDSQNFLVVVLKCIHHRGDYIQPPLCFCKVNDKSWTHIETNESRFVDIMFLGWKLYAVKEDSVTIFNLKDLNAITTERLVVQFPETNWEGQKHWRLVRDYSTCGEELLLSVTSKLIGHIDDILIFKLDMSGPRWIEVDNLNGRALFMDSQVTQVISTANLNGPPEFIRGNCVFFTLSSNYYGVFFIEEKRTQAFHFFGSTISNGHLWCNLSLSLVGQCGYMRINNGLTR